MDISEFLTQNPSDPLDLWGLQNHFQDIWVDYHIVLKVLKTLLTGQETWIYVWQYFSYIFITYIAIQTVQCCLADILLELIQWRLINGSLLKCLVQIPVNSGWRWRWVCRWYGASWIKRLMRSNSCRGEKCMNIVSWRTLFEAESVTQRVLLVSMSLWSVTACGWKERRAFWCFCVDSWDLVFKGPVLSGFWP